MNGDGLFVLFVAVLIIGSGLAIGAYGYDIGGISGAVLGFIIGAGGSAILSVITRGILPAIILGVLFWGGIIALFVSFWGVKF